MANASSMPVRKRMRTVARPMIPIVTSLIGASDDLKDLGDKDKALNKGAEAKSEGHRVEWDLEGERDLPCPVKIHAHFDEIPAQQGKESDPKESGNDVDRFSRPLRKLEDKEVHKNVALDQGGERDVLAGDDGPRECNEFIGSGYRHAEGPQHHINDC